MMAAGAFAVTAALSVFAVSAAAAFAFAVVALVAFAVPFSVAAPFALPMLALVLRERVVMLAALHARGLEAVTELDAANARDGENGMRSA